MFKNVSGQKVTLFAFDYSTGAPKTGDAANLTFYVSKDDGAVTALTDTSATELESTNAKGSYTCDLTQAETNGDKLYFTGKSSTANVAVVALTVYTVPPSFTSLTIANGCVDADVERYAGVAGTFASGRPEVNTTHWGGTAVASANVRANVVQCGGSAVAAGAIPNAAAGAANGLWILGAMVADPNGASITSSGGESAIYFADSNGKALHLIGTHASGTFHVECPSGSVATHFDGGTNVGFKISGDSNTILCVTGQANFGTIVSNITGNVTGNLSGSIGSLGATAQGNVRTAVGLASANLDAQLDAIPTNSELATAIITGLTTALTEGYRGTGATGSVRDLLYEIIGHLGESSITSTTKTVKKLDGSTTAKTYTLNSATTPTAITETT